MRFNFKSNGFTLIEVMAALAIIGFVLTALMSLEIILMRTTLKSTAKFDRIWSMVSFMRECQIRQLEQTEHDKTTDKLDKPLVKNIPDKSLSLSYQVKNIAKESSLNKLKNLSIEQVQATWKTSGNTLNDTLITFKYKAKKEI